MAQVPKRKTEYRKAVYAIITRLLGRELTVSEHEEIKAALLEYVGAQDKHVKDLEISNERQGQKNRRLAIALFQISQKRGIPEENLKFLKDHLARLDNPLMTLKNGELTKV